MADHYHMLHIVGEGCFGKVFKARRRRSGHIVAVKYIKKKGKADKDMHSLRVEVDILKKLSHENIICLLDDYETATDLCLVTEFALGELFDVFSDDGRLPEPMV